MNGGLVCARESYTRESHAHVRYAYTDRQYTGRPIDRPYKRKCDTRERCTRLLAETGAAISDCLHARALPGCRLPYTHSRCVPPSPPPPPPPPPLTATPPSTAALRGSCGTRMVVSAALVAASPFARRSIRGSAAPIGRRRRRRRAWRKSGNATSRIFIGSIWIADRAFHSLFTC